MKKLLLFTFFIFSKILLFAQIAPTNGLVAYYPFDGNANDAVGTNEGIVIEAFLSTDRSGNSNSNSYYFDGINDWINIGGNLNFNSSFTISLHSNTSNFGNNPSLFTQGTPITNGGLHIALINQSVYRFGFYGNDIESGTGFPPLNTWGHYVFTYDLPSQTRKIYLNGALIASGTSTPYTGSGTTALGKNIVQNVPNGYYNGKMDDIRIYNRALSDTEVQQLYIAEAPPADLITGLVAHYKFEDNYLDETQNNNDGIEQGGVVFEQGRPGAGKAAKFDGVDSYIVSPNNTSLQNINSITVSAWVSYNGLAADGTIPILEKSGQYFLRLYNNGSNSFSGIFNGQHGNLPFTGVQLGAWNQLTMVSSNNFFTYYLNGQKIGSIAGTTTELSNTGTLNIGANPSGVLEVLSGKLDDIRIYNRALSDTEIQQLYTAEAPPFDLNNGLVAYYPFNGNANDEAGNNDCIVNGATLTTDRYGNVDKAYSFDGTTNNLEVQGNKSSYFNEDFTFSAWLNFANGNGQFSIFSFPASYSSSLWIDLQSFYTDSNRKIFSKILSSSLYPDFVLSQNNWYHVTLVVKNNIQKIFINGLAIADESAISESHMNIAPFGYRIGQRDYVYYKGKLDDIRIYNRALTNTEVQVLYQAEAPPVDITTGLVAHYKMDGNAQDASGNGNHGTQQGGVNFTTATDRFGVAGKAAGFDGVDDYVNTNMNQNNLNQYTVATWFKTNDNDFTLIQNRGPIHQGGKSITLRYWEGKFAIVCDGDFIFIGKAINYALNNEWQHIAVTWNGAGQSNFSPNQFKIFINGVIQNSSDWAVGSSGIPLISNGTLKIGKHEAFQNFYSGSLDDYRIYNQALSDAEVKALYAMENSTISVNTSLKIAGGKSVLKIDNNYSLTTSILNTGNNNWSGNIYTKVGNNIPILLSNNTNILAGNSINITSNINFTQSQIGTNIPIEILSKTNNGDFILLDTSNGIKNPIFVDIIENSAELVQAPNISLSNANLQPGDNLIIFGDSFKPSTTVLISLADFDIPPISITVSRDGSFQSNFQVPNNYNKEILAIIAKDITQTNPFVFATVNLNTLGSNISITSPQLSQLINGTIDLVVGSKDLSIKWRDKMIKKNQYGILDGKRQFDYKIQFVRNDGIIIDIKNSYSGTELIDSEPTFGYYVSAQFLTPYILSGSSTIIGKIKIIDNFDLTREEFSDEVVLRVLTSTNNILLKREWAQSTPKKDNIAIPIESISADGVARFYFNVDFSNQIQNLGINHIELQLQDPDDSNNNDPTWMGRVMFADQNLAPFKIFTTEANAANQIQATSIGHTLNNSNAYFWYVAPDDFQKQGKPYANINSRKINIIVKIYHSNSATPLEIHEKIFISRPPVMFVHGWMGDNTAFETMGESTRFKEMYSSISEPNLYYNSMLPYSKFDDNSSILLADKNNPNSFQGVIYNESLKGIVANQVDYVCHSMGGLMLRNLLSKKDNSPYSMENQFFQIAPYNYQIKNFQKGWVHKYITINTPHFGSPGADLITGVLENLGPVGTKLLRGFDELLGGFKGIGTYQVDLKHYIPSNAVLNMQTNTSSGGKTDFKVLNNVKSHTIFSDVNQGFDFLMPNNESVFYGNLYYGALDKYDVSPGIQFLFPVITHLARNATRVSASNNTLFSNFVEQNKSQLNDIWAPLGLLQIPNTQLTNFAYSTIMSLTPLAINNLNKTMQLYGLFNEKYYDFLYNSDIIVPNLSQTSGLPTSATNVSHIQNNVETDMDRFHVSIQSKTPTINRVADLLNESISSNLFGNLPANFNPQKQITVENSQIKNAKAMSNVYEVFDRTKITITSPLTNTNINSPSQFQINVSVSDTVNLKKVQLLIGKDVFDNDTTKHSYSFVYNSDKLLPNAKNEILAAAYYLEGSEIFIKYDTISISIINNSLIKNFKVFPKTVNLYLGEQFSTEFALIYNTYISKFIDSNKLQLIETTPGILEIDSEKKSFKSVKNGGTELIFVYEGIFKDTVYVTVNNKNQISNQQISALNINLPPDEIICTGAVIEGLYSITGDSFNDDNEFVIQLSDKNGQNYQNIVTYLNGTSLSARIPHGLEDGDNYKLRVISSSPQIIGITSLQNLKIRNRDNEAIHSINNGNWSASSTWACGRIPDWFQSVTIETGHTINVTTNLNYIKDMIVKGQIQIETGAKIIFIP